MLGVSEEQWNEFKEWESHVQLDSLTENSQKILLSKCNLNISWVQYCEYRNRDCEGC